jgi:hypothetical protein
VTDERKPPPTPEEVIAAIRQTGFLLEHDVATVVTAAGFHAVLGKAFEDPDEGKSREIDVWGYHQFFREEEKYRMHVVAQLIMGCKATTNPYVIVGRPIGDGSTVRPQSTSSFMTSSARRRLHPHLRRRTRSTPEAASEWLGLHEIPGSPSLATRRGSQIVRMDRKKQWEASNTGVFDSLVYPLGPVSSRSGVVIRGGL